MTVLGHAHHAVRTIPGLFAGCRRIFSRWNRDGRVSMALGIVIAISAGVYMASMMALFHLGFSMQGTAAIMARLEQDIRKNEILLQRDTADFADAHKDILQTMEKISSITYLTMYEKTAMADGRAYQYPWR